MIRSSVILLFCLIWGATTLTTSAQSRQETEKRLNALQDQMTLDVIRISETEEMERSTMSTLRDLDHEIAKTTQLIETNQQLVRLVELSRDSLKESMSSLQKELKGHREQYQERAIHAYKYGRLHDVALILAAESINQMLIRIRYLNRFADQRRDRLTQILDSSREIEAKQEAFNADMTEAEELIKQARNEQTRLKDLQSTRRKVISDLKRQKDTLEEELKNKQEEANKLESMIRRMISSESRPTAPSNPASSAGDAKLSSSFMANKGKLPWPAQGAVVEKYGNIVNAVHGTVTPNPGILISTQSGAEVNAIFEGEVLIIDQMPEYGRVISISHGEFTSLYGNMSLVYVTAGSKVTSGQIIGRAGTEGEPKGKAIFFGLFRNSVDVDPEDWLRDW